MKKTVDVMEVLEDDADRYYVTMKKIAQMLSKTIQSVDDNQQHCT